MEWGWECIGIRTAMTDAIAMIEVETATDDRTTSQATGIVSITYGSALLRNHLPTLAPRPLASGIRTSGADVTPIAQIDHPDVNSTRKRRPVWPSFTT
jgi:hypothetical protein